MSSLKNETKRYAQRMKAEKIKHKKVGRSYWKMRQFRSNEKLDNLNEYYKYKSADTMFRDGHANTLEIAKYTLDDGNALETLLVGINTRFEQSVSRLCKVWSIQ